MWRDLRVTIRTWVGPEEDRVHAVPTAAGSVFYAFHDALLA